MIIQKTERTQNTPFLSLREMPMTKKFKSLDRRADARDDEKEYFPPWHRLCKLRRRDGGPQAGDADNHVGRVAPHTPPLFSGTN